MLRFKRDHQTMHITDSFNVVHIGSVHTMRDKYRIRTILILTGCRPGASQWNDRDKPAYDTKFPVIQHDGLTLVDYNPVTVGYITCVECAYAATLLDLLDEADDPH